MKFTIIGITDSPHPTLPPEILSVIHASKIFSGGKRHHELMLPFLPQEAVWIDITAPLDAVFEQYLPHAHVVVFASGDPLFFGFANTIRHKMPLAELEIFPTFNSLQLLAHRLQMPYHDMRIVSLTGRDWPSFDRALIECTPKIGVLTDRVHTPSSIARRMMDYGYCDYQMHVGEHLGNPFMERVTTWTLEDALQQPFSHPNSLIIEGHHQRRFGIPDHAFELLDGRERMITKMPIRLLTLQALGLSHRRVLWDIGFCTGSVSIEARLLFPHLHIVGFERRPEGQRLMDLNTRRFGAPGIETYITDFLTMDCQPLITHGGRPDAVFIGGHGGHLKEIIAKVCTVLADDGCIVMNSVTEQSKLLFREACISEGLRQEAPLHITLNDFNPIDILTCKR